MDIHAEQRVSFGQECVRITGANDRPSRGELSGVLGAQPVRKTGALWRRQMNPGDVVSSVAKFILLVILSDLT